MKFSSTKLRQAREEVDPENPWSMEELARRLDVASRTVVRWEHGEHEPDASTLARIAELTGKPMDFFFEAETPATTSKDD